MDGTKLSDFVDQVIQIVDVDGHVNFSIEILISEDPILQFSFILGKKKKSDSVRNCSKMQLKCQIMSENVRKCQEI